MIKLIPLNLNSINPDGAKIVQLIFHMYGIKKKWNSVIVRELREKGYRTYHGDPKWTANQVVKVLKNEKYTKGNQKVDPGKLSCLQWR